MAPSGSPFQLELVLLHIQPLLDLQRLPERSKRRWHPA
jgi:hypothetical protein